MSPDRYTGVNKEDREWGNGVLLFTCGGGTAPGEISGSFQGQTFDYSTLDVDEFLRLINELGCSCKHLEYDQYPENHVVIIAQKGR